METKETFAIMSLSDLRAIMRECIAEARAGQEPAPGHGLMTGKEVRGILSVSPTTLWKWSRQGYLNPVKIGGRTYYDRADIEKLREARV